MIRLTPNPTFTLPVEFAQPGSDEVARFKLVVRYLGQEAVNDWMERAKETDRAKDPEFLLEVVVGWSGVADEKGKAVAFSPEVFAQFVNAYAGAGVAITLAYLGQVSVVRAKN